MDIYKVLANFDFIQISIGTALGTTSYIFLKTFVNDIIIPLMFDIDIDKLNDRRINIFGKNIKIGRIITDGIEYAIMVIIIILVFNSIIKKFVERVIKNKDNELKDKRKFRETQINLLKHIDNKLDNKIKIANIQTNLLKNIIKSKQKFNKNKKNIDNIQTKLLKNIENRNLFY